MVFEVRRRHGLILDSAEIIDQIVHEFLMILVQYFYNILMAAVYLFIWYDRSN
jgi:hypothetical protein